uniref:Uncharacterized protein n=1 Tax=Avena sativa TaxID=4498 RepID=A0ACD6AES1_AVESA
MHNQVVLGAIFLQVGGSMTPMQSWLVKWSEWEIQAVVAVSFGLQVTLFFLAGIRRYSLSSVLKVFLWLVYLLADTTAIYALGHMSASLSKTSSDKHQLVAFWAPFLLLHLGGQDTITAYALEDNELWLRHVLNMFVQVTGTGYVLYKYIIADRATIVSSAMFVSVAGFVKYGERIWALRGASMVCNGPNRPVPKPGYEARDCFTRNTKFGAYAFIVMTAHTLRYVFVKPLIIDRNEASIVLSDATVKLLSHRVERRLDQWEDETAHKKRYTEEVYRAIEVVLALMYDMLYTKAEVLHTWYGYLIRGISFLSCFRALLTFTRSERDRYSTPDIVITFVLLVGACALEVASAFKVIGSTWTYAILRGYGWKWLANAILFARYRYLVVVKDGRWSNSVGQYDFVSFCVSDKTKLKGRIARWIGLEEWWNISHYTKHVKLSPALKEYVWEFLTPEKSGMVKIEDVAIRSRYWARRLMGFNQSEKLDWSLRSEFHNCVFIWHIATNTFLSNPEVKSNRLVDKGMAEAVNTLSDYMMYLLIQHPKILPMNAPARSLFQEIYARFVRDWSQNSKKHIENGILDVPHQIILDYMQGDLRHQDIRNLYHDMMDAGWDTYPYQGEVVLVKASILVRTLLDMELELTHKLVIIGRVWAEMLCYVATNASGDFHARQLSNGGEFLTHMLLLTKYCSIIPPILKAPYRAADDPLQPRVEVAANVELNVHNDHEEEITEC